MLPTGHQYHPKLIVRNVIYITCICSHYKLVLAIEVVELTSCKEHKLSASLCSSVSGSSIV